MSTLQNQIVQIAHLKCTLKSVLKVQPGIVRIEISYNGLCHWPTSTHLHPLFVGHRNGSTFGSSINLHAFQPCPCVQSVPASALTTRHAAGHDTKLCMPSLCHLLVDCWHVVCFCFSFQFFHAQHYTEEVLCIPCQFQYVLPAHSRLAFILYLVSWLLLRIFLFILSPCWTRSGCFELKVCNLTASPASPSSASRGKKTKSNYVQY